MSEPKFEIVDRDAESTSWKLSIPNVQGFYDLVINGYFLHEEDHPNLSDWFLYQFHKENDVQVGSLQMENTLGHGCRDRAQQILENYLRPKVQIDFNEWEAWISNDRAEARKEHQLNCDFFRHTSGFK